jgi:hypothetical protein
MACRHILLRVSLWHKPIAVSFIGITSSCWTMSTLLIPFDVGLIILYILQERPCGPALVVDPQTMARGCFGDGFIASNSPEFRNEEEPYAFAMAANSDDDRPVGELTDSDIEMLQRVFLDGWDPRVHEFSDLSLSHQVNAEGRDDELLDAPEAGPSMMIEKG